MRGELAAHTPPVCSRFFVSRYSSALTQAPSRVDMPAQNDEQQQPGICIYEQNDTKPEASAI